MRANFENSLEFSEEDFFFEAEINSRYRGNPMRRQICGGFRKGERCFQGGAQKIVAVKIIFKRNETISIISGDMDKLRQEFITPSKEYTPIPFWFWNDRLDEKEIILQINDFNEKGVNGFVIHPRMGLPKDIGYMSDVFLAYVKYAVSEAARLGMLVVLYDEGMYPSGSAHGMVVKDNPEYASRGLEMREYKSCDAHGAVPDLKPWEKLVSLLEARKKDG